MSKHLIDMEHLNEMTDGDKVFQKELFALFQKTAEHCIKSLSLQCANQNSKEWCARVHELKGSSANLGANGLSNMWKLAMEEAHAPERRKLDIINALQAEYTALKDFFSNYN